MAPMVPSNGGTRQHTVVFIDCATLPSATLPSIHRRGHRHHQSHFHNLHDAQRQATSVGTHLRACDTAQLVRWPPARPACHQEGVCRFWLDVRMLTRYDDPL